MATGEAVENVRASLLVSIGWRRVFRGQPVSWWLVLSTSLGLPAAPLLLSSGFSLLGRDGRLWLAPSFQSGAECLDFTLHECTRPGRGWEGLGIR